MARWRTVTPLHNLRLDREVRVEFADDLVLAALPDWIAKDSTVADMGQFGRQMLAEASHGFVVDYVAEGLGDPDPASTGSKAKSIQEAKSELAVLANLALWLSQPSPVCFTHVLHAPEFRGKPIVQQVKLHTPLICHQRDSDNTLSSEDFDLARTLHSRLVCVPTANAIWTAVRATWSALPMNVREVRYSLLWVALEALFGPEDGREITFRLSQRVAFFLADNPSDARELFATAKRGYAFRSKVVHGRWKENTESDALIGDAEMLVRRSLIRVLQDVALTRTFLGRNRERYLDDLVFSTWSG